MEQKTAHRIKNDYTPDFLDGQPTQTQTAKEYSYLFWYVLKGYGVPYQTVKFIFKIYELTKTGKIYHINDYQLADALGGTSRNYVCNLRKKLKEWNNGEYDSGVRHFPFVSVSENEFNKKTNAQIPTGYETSQDFENMLFRLWAKVRKHPKYQENWIIAIKEVCGGEKKTELSNFGYWNSRRQKRERSADNIFGTMLLNWKRTAARMIEFARQQGFDADATKQKLSELLPKYLEKAYTEAIIKNSIQPIKPTQNDIDLFFEKAIDYAENREEKPETVLPKRFENSRLGENKNVRSNNKFDNIRSESSNFVDGKRENDRTSATLDKVVECRKTSGFVQGKQSEANLDNETLKFLERHQKRE